MNFRAITSILILLQCLNISAQTVYAKSEKTPPTWLKSYADIERYNTSYEYKVVENEGPDLNSLQKDRLLNLGSYLKQTNKIDGTIDKIVESNNNDGNKSYKSSHKLSFKTQTSVEEFECEMIDNYWEQINIPGVGLRYRYYTLYAVSDPNAGTTHFDNYSLTTSYGVKGLWRSAIVPGWGQFYKRSYLKGGLILGGSVLLAGGIVYTECMRADYWKKQRNGYANGTEQIQFYYQKEKNFAIARNVCIGGLCALYVYNLIDAIVAPGARYVKVSKTDRNGNVYTLAPTINYDGSPMLTCSVRF